jgi:hypothetical protein
MRFSRFRGLKGRLSYANVMATLAFFFALTGGSMAATKYLTSSDQITQGDLAGSTYGNPLIAAGKVTSSKLADGAVTSAKFDSSALAPNADKLDGRDSTGFGEVVAHGTLNIDSQVLSPGQCGTYGQTVLGAAADPQFASALALVQADGFGDQRLIVRGGLYIPIGIQYTVLAAYICNGGSSDADVAGTYRYLVLR